MVNSKTNQVIAVAMMTLAFTSNSFACDDDTFSNCSNQYENARRDISETNDVLEKVRIVRDAVRSCLQCGSENFQNGMSSSSNRR